MGRERFNAMYAALQERVRRDDKWGVQNCSDHEWLAILVEEVGEIAKELCDGPTDNLRVEVTQVAAVALAWLECMERRA